MAPREKKLSDRDAIEVDPVVEAYKLGIDRSLLRRNLSRSPEERVLALMALQRLAVEARRAGRKAASGG